MSTPKGASRRTCRGTACPLSVIVTARDEEDQLPAALASVTGWADEVVAVIDPRTTDGSRELAAAAGATVLEHPYLSSSDQYNWGLERARHRWSLILDADERVSGELRGEIAATVTAPAHPAYSVRRFNFAFGRRLRFGDWGRDRIVRLVDREHARFAARAVHGAVQATSVGDLHGYLEHHTLRSLEQYLPKVYDYARRGADEALSAGTRSGLVTAISRAEWRFVRGYVLRLGVLDGMPGLVVAVLAAHGTFLKWAMVWQGGRARPPTPR
ncbi:MAG: glycosyltransferase family 2 protein [Acidobacteriota bacterium]